MILADHDNHNTTFTTGVFSVSQLTTLLRNSIVLTGTTAALPSAAANPNSIYVAKDQGKVATLYASISNVWIQVSRSVALSAVTVYVNGSTGSNANDGLTSGTALQTIQAGVDKLASIDHLNTSPTLQIANGTYQETVTTKPCVGAPGVTIHGDSTTPANVIVDGLTANTILHDATATPYTFDGIKIQCTGAGFNFGLFVRAAFANIQNVEFGHTTGPQLVLLAGATANVTGNYRVSGSAPNHVQNFGSTYTRSAGWNITITTSIVVTAWFQAFGLGGIFADLLTYTNIGFVSGSKYSVALNSFLSIAGNSVPGSSAGSTSTGGQVL
jgi:hypothetical protein